jgi:2-dehydro-3-deoxyphosphogluconate aldolase / (4S)-4-hydroxy-2-oxoglutarate aldolase
LQPDTENPKGIVERLRRCGVVAVLTVESARHAVPLAKALLQGGINAMELTLRTPAALEALRAIIAEAPEMLAGVGTILTPQQVLEVRKCGAAFGVSPGLNPRVVQTARDQGLFFAPGVATPSDIERALELECRLLKFFPAEPSGGLKYLNSMAAPYAHLNLRFIPLGGISAANVASYLKDPLVVAVGGSWVAPKDVVAREDWPAIAQLARDAAAQVRQARASA